MTVVGQAYLPPAVINEYAVMSIPAVWRGVNWLAGTMASLPKGVAKQTGRVYQPVPHPLTKLLSRRVNSLTIPYVFWETFYHHVILWGNGYALIGRESKVSDRVTGLYTLNPEDVTPFRFNGEQWYHVKNLNPTAAKPEDRSGVIPGADIIHVPGLGFDGMQGYPLVWILSETFEWARNVLRFGQRYLKKGTQIQGSIEVPANVTKDQIDLIREQVRQNHSGMGADHSHIVLGGGAKLNNTTIPPEQSQFIETKADAVVDIARVLGVSPWYLYELGRATWGNSEQQAADAVKYSLRPYIEKTEEELAAKLLTDQEQDNGLVVRFDVEDLTRGDAKSISAMAIAEVNGGIRTANEGRALLGLLPSEDPEADKLRKNAPGQGQPTPPADGTAGAAPPPPPPKKGKK
jgi:HK97 family phage portal protein